MPVFEVALLSGAIIEEEGASHRVGCQRTVPLGTRSPSPLAPRARLLPHTGEPVDNGLRSGPPVRRRGREYERDARWPRLGRRRVAVTYPTRCSRPRIFEGRRFRVPGRCQQPPVPIVSLNSSAYQAA